MILVTLLQGIWAITWCYRVMIATVSLIVCIWILLIAINIKIFSSGHWFRSVFLLWLGWITVVSFINITIVAFFTLDFGFFDDDAWALFVILSLVAGEIVWSVAFREVISVGPIAWYFYGVYFGNNSTVRSLALVFAILFTVYALSVVGWFIFNYYKQKKCTNVEKDSPAIPVVVLDTFQSENDNSGSLPNTFHHDASTNAAIA